MPAWSLPRLLAELLMAFRPCFTAPTFKTFAWLVVGLVGQPGTRTVTGMLVGARLAGIWHHSRAHRFFATARWSADQLGLKSSRCSVPGPPPPHDHESRESCRPRAKARNPDSCYDLEP
jgi:hypothetical protein